MLVVSKLIVHQDETDKFNVSFILAVHTSQRKSSAENNYILSSQTFIVTLLVLISFVYFLLGTHALQRKYISSIVDQV